MNILETNHLTFNYRNHSVLEDINLGIFSKYLTNCLSV